MTSYPTDAAFELKFIHVTTPLNVQNKISWSWAQSFPNNTTEAVLLSLLIFTHYIIKHRVWTQKPYKFQLQWILRKLSDLVSHRKRVKDWLSLVKSGLYVNGNQNQDLALSTP